MAQIRWFLNASLLDGWALVDQTAAAAATLPNGWVVGTGSTNSSEFQSAGGDRASTTFVGNTVPDGTLDTTLKDAFRSQYAQNGSFAAGNWTFQFAVIGVTQSGAADGQIVFRILKADADGSNATEITTGQQSTTIATDVGTTAVNITATWAAPAWTITNQYLFVQVAWKRTGAGGMTTTNIRLRTGSSATVGTTGLTADYTPLVLAATIASTAIVRVPTVAYRVALVPIWPFPTTGGVIDAFNRADETELSGAWLTTAVDGLRLVSNQVAPPTATVSYLGMASYLTPLTKADFEAWVEIPVPLPLPAITNEQTAVGLFADPATPVDPYVNNGLFLNYIYRGTGVRELRIEQWTAGAWEDYPIYGIILPSLPVVEAIGLARRGRRMAVFARFAGVWRLIDAGTVTAHYLPPYLSLGLDDFEAPAGTTRGSTRLDNFSGGDWSQVFAPTVTQPLGVTTVQIPSTAQFFDTDALAIEIAAGGLASIYFGTGRNESQTISGHTGVLHSVSLRPYREVGATGQLFLDIVEGSLNGRILATSAVVNIASLSTSAAWVNFPLPGGVALNAGTTYWIETYRIGGTGIVRADASASDVYAGGEVFNGFGDPAPVSFDLHFRLYIGTDALSVSLALPTQLVRPYSIWTTSYAAGPHVQRAGDLGSSIPIQSHVQFDYYNPIQYQLSAEIWDSHYYDSYDTPPGNRFGQSFHASARFSAIHISLMLNFTASTLVLEVHAGDHDGAILATATIQSTRYDTEFTFYQFDFATIDPGGSPTLYTWTLRVVVAEGAGEAYVLQGYALAPPGNPCYQFYIYEGDTTTTEETTFYTRVIGESVFAPTVALAAGVLAVTGEFIGSGVAVTQPSVSPGPVTITGATLATTASVSVPTVVPGSVTVVGATRASSAVLYGPTVGDIAPTETLAVFQRAVPQFVRDVFRRTFTLRYRRTLVTVTAGAAPPPTDQAIVGATIGGSVGDLVLEDSSGVLLEDGSGLLLEGYAGAAQTFAPTVSQIALDQAVTTVPITSGAIVRVPTVTVGPVAVTGATIAATSIARAPTTVAPGPVTVTGDTRLSTAQMFAPTVATGPVSVTGATIASTSIINVPSVAVGPVAVTGATRASTSAVTAPSVALTTTGATVASTSGLFPPQMVAQTVTTLVRLTTALLFAATVGTAVTTGTVVSASQGFAPTVAAGPVTVTGDTRLSTAQVFVPAISTGATTVDGVTIGTTVVLRAATIATGPVGVTTATVTGAPQTFAPSIAVGPVTVTGVHRATTIALFAPSVAPGAVTVLGATLPTTIQTFTASVAVGPVTVIGGTVSATAVLFVPALTQVEAGAIGAQTISTGAVINAPSVVGGLAIIGVPFIAATSAVQAPSLTVGAVTVLAASRPSTTQTFVPSLAVGAVTVTGATRTTSSQTFAPSLATGPVTITGATRATTSLIFNPTVAVGPVTILAPTRASVSLTFAPSLTTLTFITTTPIASTATLFAPTVLTIGSLGGPTTGSTVQLFGVTVTTGPVAVTGGTVTSALQVFAPTVLVGGTAITGGTIGTTALLFAPTTIARLDGTFIASTASLFPPTVKITQFVTTAPVLAGATPFAPSALAVWAVTGGTRLSTTQTFAPSITTGAIGVIGSTVPATVLVTAPAVGVGPVAVTLSHRASTLLAFAPSVSYVVDVAHRTSAVALFPPALATGPVAVSTGAIVSTIQMFPPSLGAGITTAFFANTTVPFAPTLAPHVTTPLWIVRTQLFPPSAIPLGEMILTFLPSGSVVFPPFMVGYAPPPEILDFTSNLVREVMGDSSLDRVAEQDVVLTTAVTGDVILTRLHETSARVLVDRVLAITVER